jgi:hypothetical protein
MCVKQWETGQARSILAGSQHEVAQIWGTRRIQGSHFLMSEMRNGVDEGQNCKLTSLPGRLTSGAHVF